MQSYKADNQVFDVVMIKKGVSEWKSLPQDFKRIRVIAPDTLAAQLDESVEAETEYSARFVVPAGVMSDLEIHARRRELDNFEQTDYYNKV